MSASYYFWTGFGSGFLTVSVGLVLVVRAAFIHHRDSAAPDVFAVVQQRTILALSTSAEAAVATVKTLRAAGMGEKDLGRAA